MKRELTEANKYFEKNNFSELKTKHEDSLKKFYDMNNLSKDEKDNLAKVFIASEEKNKDLESRFLGDTNAMF